MVCPVSIVIFEKKQKSPRESTLLVKCQKMIRFLGKNIVGSRIRTYDPRYPRSRIRQEPQWLNRDVGYANNPPDLHRMGARGNLGSGALDRSAIPTHIMLRITLSRYLLLSFPAIRAGGPAIIKKEAALSLLSSVSARGLSCSVLELRFVKATSL